MSNLRIPNLSAVLNVANQAISQVLPQRSKTQQPEDTMEQTNKERVRFARNSSRSYSSEEQHEMSNMNNTTSTNPFKVNNIAEESFTEGKSRMSSMDFSDTSEDFVEGKSDEKIDEYQAAWNVTNAIQGMFIVSLPFAVQRGGYWAIAAMIGVAYICDYTGKILVECLYEFDVTTGKQVRVRNSYVAIAKECFGKKYGARAVNIAQIIELLMTCILYVVVCGDLMKGSFPDWGSIDTRSWMMLVGILMLPLGFLKSLASVSTLSFYCTLSHLFINAIILGYCLLYIPQWGWSKVKWSLDLENFPICLGVIVFSYTSQIFLPTLEGNMTDPSKFQWMLDWSHFWAAIFKAAFGYICFLTFQNDTQQVITNNLPSQGFKALVNLTLVLKALLSYPLPYYAACELLERSLFRGKPKTMFSRIYDQNNDLKVWGLAWRVSVVTFTVMMACFIPHFSILMGFIGSFTGTMLSFIWPCYFHLKLKREGMDSNTVFFEYFVISLGVLFGVVGIYDSGCALIKAFAIGLPF